MQGDSDISRLYREFGGDPGEYREITEQEKAEAARHRWPMFDRALPGDAGVMPPSVDEGRTEMPLPAAPWPPGGASAAPAALPPVSGGHGAPLRRGAALGAGSTHRWWTDAQQAQPGEAQQGRVEPETISVAHESEPAAVPPVEPAVVATSASVAEIAAPEAPVAVEPAVVAMPAAAPVAEIAVPEAPVAVEPAVVATPAAAPVAEVAAPEAPVAVEAAVVAMPAPVAEAAVPATAAPVPEAAAPAVAAVPPAQSAKPSAVAGGSSLKGVFARLAQAHRSDAQPPSGSGA
ncbi:cellulose biosynthesis protein BcsP [Bordetella trematum]|uniref:cellulose biosynthesis protein BcsP n=1 Tax=Bordetella trematum TaxID=123899 RepID=UPI0015C57F38|nr:cellulose biosynthesis protein BcsP [Bordetella trematum]